MSLIYLDETPDGIIVNGVRRSDKEWKDMIIKSFEDVFGDELEG